MLRHAEKQGARVFEETRVESIEFEGEPDSSRPVAANWSNKQGVTGKITFDWLVDASGRAGIMSTKYLANREMRESLRNVAVWAYWKDVKRYEEGTKKANSGWFEALTGMLRCITCTIVAVSDQVIRRERMVLDNSTPRRDHFHWHCDASKRV